MRNRQFSEFVNRLSKLKEQIIPKKLLGLIKKKELFAIVDHVLTNSELTTRIKSLQPKQAIRLKKEESGLTRTVSVVVTPKKQIQCILETKSKDKNNHKRDLHGQKIDGSTTSNKRGKPGWRLDDIDGPAEYMSMVIQINGNTVDKRIEKLQEIYNEVALGWHDKNDLFFHPNILGALYENKKGYQQSIYSFKGIPLDDAIDHGIDGEKLTKAQCNSITLQLLKRLDLMHKKGLIHQDIKLENILLLKHKNGDIEAKFIDLDMVCPITETHQTALATKGYESPEIALAHRRKSLKNYAYFANCDSLGNKLSKTIDGGIKESIRFQKPHQANDVWALGIVLYRLNHGGKKPKELPRSWALRKMLAPKREDRMTAAEAYLHALQRQPIKMASTLLKSSA